MTLSGKFSTCTKMDGWMDGWMDGNFTSFVKSISVISGQWQNDNEKLCAMKPHLWFNSLTIEK